MNISKGDYVIVEYPNSCFRLGGTVTNIITINNKQQYEVVFSVGSGVFLSENIVGHSPKSS